VVKDVAGFLVNRLLGPYLDEAIRLYTSGVDPERLDRLAEEFGMPMGPMRLLDEVGLDIAGHAALSLHSAYGDRMAPCTAIRPLLEAGHLGKKTGRGFYDHRKAKSSTGPLQVNDKLAELAPATSSEGRELPDSVIIDHLSFAMLAEGLRALEENVTQTPDELDLATVFGMGFAPFRGGLLRWADSLGADEVQRRLEALRASRLVQSRGGGAARFDTPLLLEKYAAEGRKFRP
jgi:3-hydroxyacyl-CoA dehydrogenase